MTEGNPSQSPLEAAAAGAGLPASDAFELLGNETRLAILLALWEAEVPHADGNGIPFSELRERVGMADSGQFNYHLEQLLGTFVTKTADGYTLTQAGKHVNGAIASGAFTGFETTESIDLDSACRSCGGDQTLSYENEVARIECHSCPVGWSVPVPPAVLAGYDHEELPRVISRYFQTRFRKIIDGFCGYCEGPISRRVGPIHELEIGPESETDPSEDGDAPRPDLLAVQFDCQRCGATSGLGLDYALLFAHPEVARFYAEHGIDVRNSLIWDIELQIAEIAVENRDPLRGRVSFRKGDSELVVTVDETFSVIDIQQG